MNIEHLRAFAESVRDLVDAVDELREDNQQMRKDVSALKAVEAELVAENRRLRNQVGVLRAYVEQGSRGSGRTTRMIEDIVSWVCMHEGQVAVVALDELQAMSMRRQLQGHIPFAHRMRQMDIVIVTPASLDGLRGRRLRRLFVDHAAWGRILDHPNLPDLLVTLHQTGLYD